MATTEPQATGVQNGELSQLVKFGVQFGLWGGAGYMSVNVTREVNRLCDEMRGDAEALVDAFGIPDQVLRAPIGLRDPA
jgi:Acyl-CoA oxidase